MYGALAQQLSVSAILAHPKFPAILLAYADRLLAMRRGERLMNQLLAQREHELLGFLLLCQHYAHLEGGPPPTLARLAASNLGSARRVGAFVNLLRSSGLARATPDPEDKRQRILEPTRRLIDLYRDGTQAAFHQIDRFLETPLLEWHLATDLAFHRRACLIGAEDIFKSIGSALDRFPLVDFLAPHRGGHLIVASLAQALCAGGRMTEGLTIKLPYGRLARRLGVSRSHVLNVFAATAEKGHLETREAGRRIELTAASRNDLLGYFAHELSSIGQNAVRACDPSTPLDIAWLSR